MKVISLETSGYRNLSDGIYEFSDGVNVIFGNNAQGKTNLIECIWLFTGTRSFRGAKDAELTKIGEQASSAKMNFFAKGREQTAQLRYGEEKSAMLNGVPLRSAAKLSGEFCSVVFSPADIGLISGSPSERRKFLDSTLCQLKPKYAAAINEYGRAIAQRSTVLRDIRYHRDLEPLLDVYEAAAASSGAYIVSTRKSYIDFFAPFAAEYHGGFSGGRENLELSYEQSAQGTETREALAAAMKESRSEDILTGNTSVGPHRDDLFVSVNGLAARNFASQGQKRSASLALRLAEANALMTYFNEPPVILLDDVMSELDTGRKKYVLNSLGDRQIFITCCTRADLRGLKAGRTMKMTGGKMTVL